MGSIVEMTDDGLIKKTQSLRNQILDKLTKDGTDVPTDPDSVGLLLEIMKDVDRTALSKLKIKSDDSNQEADRLLALAIARTSQHYGSKNPFERVIEGEVVKSSVSDNRGTADPKLLPNIVVVPGNKDIGTSSETYDSFINKMEPDGKPILFDAEDDDEESEDNNNIDDSDE